MSELIGLVNRLSRATASGRWSGSAGTDDVDKFDLNGLKESEASRLVSAVLGGTSVRNDLRGPGAVDGAYDFTVALPSGRKIALEVTTAANQAMIGTLAALQQMLDGNYPSLRFNWSLTGRHPAAGRGGPRVKAIAGSADNLLRRLEDAQLLSFDEYHPFRRDVVEPDALDAIAQLRRIGVIGAVAMDPVADESEAFVALSLMGGGDPAVDRTSSSRGRQNPTGGSLNGQLQMNGICSSGWTRRCSRPNSTCISDTCQTQVRICRRLSRRRGRRSGDRE